MACVNWVGAGDPSSPSKPPAKSRWLKLRTTVQLGGAITQSHKKPPLKREDSFLKRFSTRQSAEPTTQSAHRSFIASQRVLNPDENALFMWLSVLTACVLHNAWTLIVRQAFPELQHAVPRLWFGLDLTTDVVFLADIGVQFRTGYLEQGLMVCDSAKLARHYIRSQRFALDLLALTPLDLVQLWTGPLPIVRIPRFLKLYRAVRFYYMAESRTIYPNMWRVVNLVHILLLLAHWFGCFYYMISELEGFCGSWSYPNPRSDLHYTMLARKYLGSVYWSTLTLTTIGDLATPSTNLQYAFTIVSYLIGVFIFATIVGQVGNVITNRNASRLEFERLLDGAKLYMRHHKVPRDMQRRVQRWYDYSWSRGRMQGGGDINSALGLLPDKLKTELALHVNLKTLKKVTIFQECQPEFLHDLVLKMRAYIFTPGDLICRKGEVAREMFIIADGILEVISESGKVLTQMKAGDFFGEIGILNLDGFNRRTADVRSVGYSELFSLSRDDVLSAMKDYPEAQDILQTMGRKRLMEARLAASGKTAVAPTQDSSDHRPVVVKKLKGLLRGRSQAAKDDDGDSLATATSEDTAALTGNAENPAPLRKLIKKIKWKGPLEGGAQPLKGIAQKFSHFKTQLSSVDGVKNHRQESFSLESVSAAPDLPIGQGLPLLQRIKMLKELENSKKAAAAAEETKPPLTKIGEGLPLLERVKMLRAAEREKEKLVGSSKSSSKGSISSSEASPKSSDPPADDTKNQELPLLKRILLLKEKEAKETKANSGLTPHGSDAGEKESKPDKDTKSGPQKEPKPDKDTKSGPQKEPKPDKESEPQNDPDNAPESGELKEIKATETAPPPPPPPPPPPLPTRLKENNKKSPPQTSEAQVVERREDQQRLPTSSRSRDQLMRQNTPEGYAARRSRFYRMLAVDDLEDDGTNNDGIQDYLAKITKNVRQAMITYMNENQTELKARIIRLEEELRLKDLLIRDLQNALERSGTPYPDREAFSPPPPAVTAEESHDSEEDDEEDDDAFSDDSQQTVMENSPAHQAACQEPRLSPPSEKIEVKPEDMWMLEFQGSRSEESLESAPPTVLVSGDPDEDDLPNNRRHSTGSKPASPPAKSPRKLLAKMGSLRKYSLMDERLLKTSASRRRKLSLQLLFGRSVRQSSECLAEDGGDPAAASPVSDPGSSSWRSEDTALPTISEHSRAAESVVISIPESQPSSGSPP